MEKDNNVNLDVLRRICEALRVNLRDVAEFMEEYGDQSSQCLG